jgi:hypothetical protein
VRLFATVYNDTTKPEDPYEFIDIILPEKLESTERNSIIEEASEYLKNNTEAIDSNGNIVDLELKKKVENIIKTISGNLEFQESGYSESASVIKILKETAKSRITKRTKEKSVQEKAELFLASFLPEEMEYARKLLWVAKKSYQLRDDDNISLGKVKANLTNALKEANQRLGHRIDNIDTVINAEEAIKALKFPDYIPSEVKNIELKDEIVVLKCEATSWATSRKGYCKR